MNQEDLTRELYALRTRVVKLEAKRQPPQNYTLNVTGIAVAAFFASVILWGVMACQAVVVHP